MQPVIWGCALSLTNLNPVKKYWSLERTREEGGLERPGCPPQLLLNVWDSGLPFGPWPVLAGLTSGCDAFLPEGALGSGCFLSQRMRSCPSDHSVSFPLAPTLLSVSRPAMNADPGRGWARGSCIRVLTDL